MNIAKIKLVLKSYFGFHYLTACIIFVIIFGSYMYIIKKRNRRMQHNYSKKEMCNGLFLSLYLVLLLSLTLLNRSVVDRYQMELAIFWSYQEILLKKNMSLIWEVFCNIILFVPWSFLFAQVFPAMKRFRWTVGSAFLFSVFIEITQFVLKIGLFEFDDMFHNTLGAVIGYRILTLYRRQKQKGVDEYSSN